MRGIALLACAGLGVVALAGSPAVAQEAGGTQTPQARAEACLAAVQKGEIDAAIDNLVSDSPMLQAKPQELAVLKNQTRSLLPIYGAMQGFEKVKEESVGTSITYFVFVARHEKHPIAWRFIFYRSQDRWFVSAFKWSDAYEGLF